MPIETTRFGPLEIGPEHELQFPAGLVGMEELRRWALLADTSQPAVAWLQSLERGDVALAVVSPRRFVPSYYLRVTAAELAPLNLRSPAEGEVLAILGRNEWSLTLNLRAPLVVNPQLRLGRQVIAEDEEPIRYELNPRQTLRKSA